MGQPGHRRRRLCALGLLGLALLGLLAWGAPGGPGPRWREVPGRVIGLERDIWRDREGSRWLVHVGYTYQVAGVEYCGVSVRADGQPLLCDERACAAVAARFPAGSATAVWVDRDDPWRAALERPNGSLLDLPLAPRCGLLGGLMVAVGAVGWLVLARGPVERPGVGG